MQTKTQPLDLTSEALANKSIPELTDLADNLYFQADTNESREERIKAKKNYNSLARYLNQRVGRKMMIAYRRPV